MEALRKQVAHSKSGQCVGGFTAIACKAAEGTPGAGSSTRRPSAATLAVRSLVLTCLVGLSGCNFALPIMYLVQGPPMIEPEFTKLRSKKVAIVCETDTNTRYNFASVDTKLARRLAMHLRDAYTFRKIEVIAPDEVYAWLDEHDDWTDVSEVGEALEADYVLYVDLERFHLFEENSPTMYRGRAAATIRVYEMEKDGELVFETSHESAYPTGEPISTADIRRPVFEQQYIDRLADEIGRYFYPYHHGDDVSHFGYIAE